MKLLIMDAWLSCMPSTLMRVIFRYISFPRHNTYFISLPQPLHYFDAWYFTIYLRFPFWLFHHGILNIIIASCRRCFQSCHASMPNACLPHSLLFAFHYYYNITLSDILFSRFLLLHIRYALLLLFQNFLLRFPNYISISFVKMPRDICYKLTSRYIRS